MTTTSNRTNAKTSKSEKLLGINDVAQKLDMSYHEARNFLVRVPVAKTGERGAHLYRLEDITKAREANAEEAGNQALPGTKEWHEVEKIRRQVEKLDVELEGMEDGADVGCHHRKLRINPAVGGNGWFAKKRNTAKISITFKGQEPPEGYARIDNQLIKLLP